MVPHHLVGDLSPEDPDSVVSFLDRAREVLGSPGPDLVVAGGTCQYLEVLRRGLDAQPPPDPRLREEISGRLRTEGQMALWTDLKSRVPDPPPDAERNPVRLVRALEKAILRERGIEGRSHPALASEAPIFALRWSRDRLHARLSERMEAMFVRGWLQEVDQLRGACPPEAPAWRCIGFEPLRKVLEGSMDLEAAKASILEATRQYAKRQETFLRNRLAPVWIDGELPLATQVRALEDQLP